MITVDKYSRSQRYRINETALSFTENYQGVNKHGNPIYDVVYVSIVSNAAIMVFDPNNGIEYGDDLQYQRWRLSGATTGLVSSDAHNIYARLNKQGSKEATIIFSVRNYNTDGSITKLDADGNPAKDEEGNTIYELEASDTYWYIPIGTLTELSDTGRTLTFDPGNLSTQYQQNEQGGGWVAEMFELVRDAENLIRAKLRFEKLQVKGESLFDSIANFYKGIKIGPSGSAKSITSVATDLSTSEDATDAAATPAYVKAFSEGRYLSKISSDPQSVAGPVTFKKDVTVQGNHNVVGDQTIGENQTVKGKQEVKGLQTLHEGFKTENFDALGGHIQGAQLTSAGVLTTSGIVTMSFKTWELIYNVIRAQGGKTVLSNAATVESVAIKLKTSEDLVDTYDGNTNNIDYVLLTIKADEHNKGANPFKVGDILYGSVNSIGASGDVAEGGECTMHVIEEPNNMTVKAQLYPVNAKDDAGYDTVSSNIAPTANMTIAQRGNVTNVERRTAIFLDGEAMQIVMLQGVNTPRIQKGNYGNIIGVLPPALYGDIQKVFAGIKENDPVVYAEYGIFKNFIRYDHQGNYLQTENNRGEWEANTTYENNASYYDVVTYLGQLWKCIKENKGIAPQRGQYWLLLVAKGADGGGIVSEVVTYALKETTSAPENFPESDWGSFPSELKDGWWLYTRTVTTYTSSSETSYSVSQIGQGSYYAGLQEYYAIGSSSTNPPNGYPISDSYQYNNNVALYPSGVTPSISNNWKTSRPTLKNSKQYLWNFTISRDSKGNQYVVYPICIANFAKSIQSIDEYYAISWYSYANKEGQDYPTDIDTNDWTSSQVAPTNDKPYQWNKTVVTYDDGSDTHYHVSAVKGDRGAGINSVTPEYATTDTFFQPTLNSDKWSETFPTSIPEGHYLWIKTVTDYAEGKDTVTISVSKVGSNGTSITVSKTEYVISEDGQNIPTEGWEEVTNGQLPKSEDGKYLWSRVTFSDGSMQYSVSKSGTSITIDSIEYAETTDANANPANLTYRSTVPTPKSGYYIWTKTTYSDGKIDYGSAYIPKNGEAGKNSIYLDLDNEMDSMLYDENNSLLSGNVTATATLYDGGTNITSGISWNKEAVGCDASIINGIVTVTGLTAERGTVKVTATYNNIQYYATLSVVKLVNADKYEVVCEPKSIAYNTTTGIASASTIAVSIYKTSISDGKAKREKLTKLDTSKAYNLYVDGTLIDYSKQKSFNVDSSKSYHEVTLKKGTLVIDNETIPINKTADGANSIKLDLTNQFDSIIYDDKGDKLSGDVTTIATIYDGGKIMFPEQFDVVYDNCDGVDEVITDDSGKKYEITIKGIREGVLTAKAIITAKYGGVICTSVFTIVKLVNETKYEIKCSNDSFTYNKSTDTFTPEKITASVYKTYVKDGSVIRELVEKLGNEGLYLIGDVAYPNEITPSTDKSEYEVALADGTSYKEAKRIYDIETIPVNTIENGGKGDNALSIIATPSVIGVQVDANKEGMPVVSTFTTKVNIYVKDGQSDVSPDKYSVTASKTHTQGGNANAYSLANPVKGTKYWSIDVTINSQYSSDGYITVTSALIPEVIGIEVRDKDGVKTIGIAYVSLSPVQTGLVGEAGKAGPQIIPSGYLLFNQAYNLTYAEDGVTVTHRPLVYYEGDKNYYLLKQSVSKEDNILAKLDTYWEVVTNYGPVFTDVLMAQWSKLAQAIFWGNYMFSQKGVVGDDVDLGNNKLEDVDFSYFKDDMFKNIGTVGDEDYMITDKFIPHLFLDLKRGLMKTNKLSETFREFRYCDKDILDESINENESPVPLITPVDVIDLNDGYNVKIDTRGLKKVENPGTLGNSSRESIPVLCMPQFERITDLEGNDIIGTDGKKMYQPNPWEPDGMHVSVLVRATKEWTITAENAANNVLRKFGTNASTIYFYPFLKEGVILLSDPRILEQASYKSGSSGKTFKPDDEYNVNTSLNNEEPKNGGFFVVNGHLTKVLIVEPGTIVKFRSCYSRYKGSGNDDKKVLMWYVENSDIFDFVDVKVGVRHKYYYSEISGKVIPSSLSFQYDFGYYSVGTQGTESQLRDKVFATKTFVKIRELVAKQTSGWNESDSGVLFTSRADSYKANIREDVLSVSLVQGSKVDYMLQLSAQEKMHTTNQ